ncbi:MAG: N-acetyltransferase [Alphaproteobacteria bacterium]|nr:MAG: N-acetyltransferase [Alphaproteobacteria bacterium]
MTIIIRDAREADIPAIFAVRTSVGDNHLSVEQMSEMGITHETIAETLRNQHCLWVAEQEGKIVGFSMALSADACVFALFVRPEWEGHGIGRLLLERAEEFLFESHETIWLQTDVTTPAARFYKRLGWSQRDKMETGDTRFEKRR